ncbi:hypothetical protein COCC4DRAFT_31623 [Bipolaris maydis ATCC 48331]|uniref:Uncharacterized protein n=2 Tax=Cochliobolus heterostrophus TaxID=5016 RepID=M2TIV3_COCH5|nr:uncharacterized protein COCC4DRAFT_31623 [Bipolaris maydis ATCC 48331]EMD86439.1 hypothetical protein COCHEDRAFT_1024080 [Bipolaris maydis C5]ENI06390.1 hypothetical protein COCC4DRAFT_31623 [Bipolaris maydis ATCC 48331]
MWDVLSFAVSYWVASSDTYDPTCLLTRRAANTACDQHSSSSSPSPPARHLTIAI